jgi:hypothetical protein
MLAAVAPALSIRRISTVSPPAILLLAWLLSRTGKSRAAVTLAVVSAMAAVSQIAVVQLRPGRTLDLPIGRVAIPPKANYYDIYRWMGTHSKPGQWYFGLPPLTLALELRNPTPMSEISPGEYTRPEQVASIVQGIEKARVPVIVLRSGMYASSVQSHLPDHLQLFRNDLYLHYRETMNFPSGDQIWQRIDK